MRKLWITLFIWIFAGTAFAQIGDWGVWEGMLYDATTGTVYEFDSEQNVNTFSLPIPEGATGGLPTSIAVSRDGDTLAYVVYDAPRANSAGPYDANMVVFRRSVNIVDAYPFVSFYHHSLDYPITPYVFSPDNTRLAVGYYQETGWNIAVLDVVNRTYGAVLSSSSANAAQAIVGAALTYEQPLPIVTVFDGTRIEFALIPSNQTELPNALNSYVWNTTDNTVQSTVRFSSLAFDYFPTTNEVVQAEQNSGINTNPSAFPDGQNNALAVSADMNERIAFFASAQFDLSAPHFVQNGNKVLFRSSAADGGETWTVVPRGGGQAAVISNPFEGMNLGISDVAATEYGALLLTETDLAAARLGLPLQGGQTLLHLDLRDERPLSLDLVANFPDDTGPLAIIWSSYTTTTPQSGYGAWVSVTGANNTFTAQSEQAATPVPATLELTLGGEALVFTTEGDPLNVRSGPGTGFSELGEVQSGDVVQLLEGPVAGDGLTWWRIRGANGVEGWAVESADNVRTLQPVIEAMAEAAPMAATPEPILSTRLTVGGQAIVSLPTTDAANMRAEPNTAARIVNTLLGGTVVNVIGGPIEGGGLIWWQVQLPAGGPAGWVVETVDGLNVLSPNP